MGQSFQSLSGSHGATNGTTPVSVVPAPGSGVCRVLKRLSVYNADTANISIFVQMVDSSDSSTTTIDSSGAVAPGQTYVFGANMEIDALTATTQNYQVVLLGAKTTNNAQFKTTYADYS